MARPDDSSLTAMQQARIRREAERALREAGALGTVPTPIDQIMAVARVEEVKEDVLNPGFLMKLRKKALNARQAVKQALGKVLGIFHASEGLIFLSHAIIEVKKRFIGLHETAHGFLPWQRPMYALVEDCAKALDGETSELFDREANAFAAEVLFQLDLFREITEGDAFEIWTPIRHAKNFKASNYAAIRQYVSKNHRACAVIVLNKPEIIEGIGFRATLRRAIASDRFRALVGAQPWQDSYTPDDQIGSLIPLGHRKSSGKRSIGLTDLNGNRLDCVAESFATPYQVFVLIHVIGTLTAHRILMSA
jgi:hypothetical protein